MKLTCKHCRTDFAWIDEDDAQPPSLCRKCIIPYSRIESFMRKAKKNLLSMKDLSRADEIAEKAFYWIETQIENEEIKDPQMREGDHQ